MRYSRDSSQSRQMKVMQFHAAAAIIALSWLGAQSAWAAEKPAPKNEELDVTMQIISDPNAKRPDEVIRRIPLPTPKADNKAPSNATADPGTPGQDNKGQGRADAAKELGGEMSERAKERAQNAAEQREEARRAKADEHAHNNPHPPPSPPGRPANPGH